MAVNAVHVENSLTSTELVAQMCNAYRTMLHHTILAAHMAGCGKTRWYKTAVGEHPNACMAG